MKKIVAVLLFGLLISSVTIAQQKSYLFPNTNVIKHSNFKELYPLDKSNWNYKEVFEFVVDDSLLINDTLKWNTKKVEDFGFFGNDRIVQWFETPDDMRVLKAGFRLASVDGLSPFIELKLVKLNWTKDQVLYGPTDSLGYYPGNLEEFNYVSAFEGDPETSGDWISTPNNQLGSPFGEDIWATDEGKGYSVPPSSNGNYKWVEMLSLLNEPILKKGEIFGVVLKNTGPAMGLQRIGVVADNTTSIPGFKYYAKGRYDSLKGLGWWKREYAFDVLLEVEYFNQRKIVIDSVSIIPVAFENETIEINTVIFETDSVIITIPDLPTLHWSVKPLDSWNSVTMNKLDSISFTAEIPGQAEGQFVYYKVSVPKSDSVNIESIPNKYFVHKVNNDFLFIYDGSMEFDNENDLWQEYYGKGTPYLTAKYSSPDYWQPVNHGPISAKLLDNYRMVFWNTGFYPATIPNSEPFKDWLDNATPNNTRRLLVTGQDYGRISGFRDIEFGNGDFEYEYLGIKALAPQDIVGGTVDNYFIDAVEKDSVSGYLFDLVSDNYRLAYSPLQLNGTNWVDNIEPVAGAHVFLTDPHNHDAPIGIMRSSESFISAYIQVDPFCLVKFNNADSSISNIALTERNIIDAFFEYAVSTELKEKNNSIHEFSLAQNYPNPFNPSTKITYTIPNNFGGKVATLKIYNWLGEEIAELVNRIHSTGQYEVTFNGSKLASGVYFYTLRAGNYSITKKMLMIK